MSVITTEVPRTAPTRVQDGALARLGRWSATHLRAVLLLWLLVIAGLGAFAPRIESALSGAGWQDSTSQSVRAREVITRDFKGLGATALQVVVHDQTGPISSDPTAQRIVARASELLQADPRITVVVAPQAGASLSRDGATAVIQAGANASANDMVRAVDDLAGPLSRLGTSQVSVNLTGDSAVWADFNRVNRAAMIKSEVLSWPVTMLVLVLAFGSLIAAGLPLMLTLVGLLSAAGALVLSTYITPVSIWALNFALMFAVALGIDYALFLVVRFRAALASRADQPHRRSAVQDAIAETMATAGKAITFSGVTVLVSLSTVLIVPSPAFRSTALGIMLSVVGVLAATLTLLPAVLGRLGSRVDAGRVRLPARWRRPAWRPKPNTNAASPTPRQMRGLELLLHRWSGLLARRPLPAAGLAILTLAALAWPVLGLRTAMPSIAIVPADQSSRAGYVQLASAFGPGAPGQLQVLTPTADLAQAEAVLSTDPGVAAALPGPTNNGWALRTVVPTSDASAPATGHTIERLRSQLPPESLIGGAAAENHDLATALSSYTPLVFGLLIGLGFLLLLIALGSPLIAFAGVITNLASIAAAFGAAKMIFQDGQLSGLLHFQPQGFIDAWAPLFFGAMLTGIAMDYTLFLLSAARERYDATGDPQQAMRAALRTSGRVVVAAAAVMVAVFMTFALSGPLAPKEMGIILAVAVFLDAACIRLIILPVILRLTGHAAWYSPRWLTRLLPSVHFTH